MAYFFSISSALNECPTLLNYKHNMAVSISSPLASSPHWLLTSLVASLPAFSTRMSSPPVRKKPLSLHGQDSSSRQQKVITGVFKHKVRHVVHDARNGQPTALHGRVLAELFHCHHARHASPWLQRQHAARTTGQTTHTFVSLQFQGHTFTLRGRQKK